MTYYNFFSNFFLYEGKSRKGRLNRKENEGHNEEQKNNKEGCERTRSKKDLIDMHQNPKFKDLKICAD